MERIEHIVNQLDAGVFDGLPKLSIGEVLSDEEARALRMESSQGHLPEEEQERLTKRAFMLRWHERLNEGL